MGQTHLLPREEMLETGKRKKRVTIGIPKDSSPHENRIPLTPQGVELLRENGHTVLFEAGAGDRAHYFDHDFAECGAKIVKQKEVFTADIILKISAPNLEEIELLQPNQVVFSLIYLYNQSRETIQKMMEKRINAIGFELLKDGNN